MMQVPSLASRNMFTKENSGGAFWMEEISGGASREQHLAFIWLRKDRPEII